MSDHILQQLQQSADLALKSQTVQEGVQHLSHAFALFSEEAARLKSAYSRYQERLETVNQELAMQTASGVWLRRILREISDGIFFIHLDGTIALCNEAAQLLLKIKPEQIQLKKYWEVFQDELFGFSMREALKFGISHQHLYQKELEISTSFVYEGPKSSHGMILIVRDIGEAGGPAITWLPYILLGVALLIALGFEKSVLMFFGAFYSFINSTIKWYYCKPCNQSLLSQVCDTRALQSLYLLKYSITLLSLVARFNRCCNFAFMFSNGSS